MSKQSRLFFTPPLTAVEENLCVGMWCPFFTFYPEIISNLEKSCKHSLSFCQMWCLLAPGFPP